jgi:hypothetical protein
MDKSIFGPLADYLDEQILVFYNCSSYLTIINHKRFMIFTHARDKATTPANIKEGFHVTVMHRFILSTIPSEAFAPSLATQNKEPPVPIVAKHTEIPALSVMSRNGFGNDSSVLIHLSQM